MAEMQCTLNIGVIIKSPNGDGVITRLCKLVYGHEGDHAADFEFKKGVIETRTVSSTVIAPELQA